ncbi:MAG: metalloprotease TldD [Gammaproteobacteria bacterium]|jgi:TldD protein
MVQTSPQTLSVDTSQKTALDLVHARLLEPTGLDIGMLEQLLARLLETRLDYADLYFQSSRHESWAVEDGIVRSGAYSADQGVGVRAVVEDKTGFAYADRLDRAAIEDAIDAARAISRHHGSGRVAVSSGSGPALLYGSDDPLLSIRDAEKVELLSDLDAAVRRLDERIVQVSASLAAVHDYILVVASDGTLAADVRPLVRMNIAVILEHGGRREQGYAGAGGRYGYERFLDPEFRVGLAREAVRQADVNMRAIPAPAGNMAVVLGSGWPGVLLHEAIGHGLEGDFNRKGTSAFSGRIGERVATDQCTVVDDGTLPQRRGSLAVDDEGTATRCTTLIENGVLTGYMHDKMNARLMGQKSTGNARRESFAHVPMPRMTNTYMLPGARSPEEIIESVDSGVYASNFGGGQVDITSGKFVFSASEAYLIEKGRLGAPIKGAMLIGNGPEVLTRVSMVGNDLSLDPGIGICGKEGQSVPVGVGQPTLKIDSLTVGGTQTS